VKCSWLFRSLALLFEVHPGLRPAAKSTFSAPNTVLNVVTIQYHSAISTLTDPIDSISWEKIPDHGDRVKCLTVTRSFVIVAVCGISFTATLQAQFRGSLRGTVTDPQGRAIPGAKATLLDTGTNHTQMSISDASGIYQFNALAPAPYRLTVEAQGFHQKVLEQVQIIPDQPNALDLTLAVGQVQQSITVSGIIEALDTETA